ncbi:MAG TPA: DUF302 domain-containing protein [Candidatus Acidoferrales bacterium]|nr:DUF302 domain-containing protein [Candidatus Acidoferrales bacterium]
MTHSLPDGLTSILSNHSVDQTLANLQNVLHAKNIAVFAIVDHSGEAEKAGMAMPPTKLVLFGSPKAGTPLMLASPSVAIDLPLKILISEDHEKKIWVSYNSLKFLQDRHSLPEQLMQNLAAVEAVAAAITQ